MVSSKALIIATLAYSDIFHYPLTLEEFSFYCIGKPLSQKEIEQEVQKIPSITKQQGFFVFKGREHLVEERLKRRKISEEKLALIKTIGKCFHFIPTISFVGISGGLAMKNATEDDDIDLFILTHHNTVWITRLLVTVILFLFGKKRPRKVVHAKDMVCPNMFLDEQAFSFKKEQQNLYTAHEIVQVKPLGEMGAYIRFLKMNTWVEKYLPNAYSLLCQKQAKEKKRGRVEHILLVLLESIEPLARTMQSWYMGKHRTRERVSKYILAFHPRDYEREILDAYKERIIRYEK